jgi:hypothetical protein
MSDELSDDPLGHARTPTDIDGQYEPIDPGFSLDDDI